jgi:hypothetical protein
MNKVVRLCTPEACLEVDISNEQWCRCILACGRTLHRLGAERLDHIVRQLLHVLSSPWEEMTIPVVGLIDGYEVRWALSFSEEHSTLYVAAEGRSRLLFAENKGGILLCKMHLLPSDLLEWCTQLRILAGTTSPE